MSEPYDVATLPVFLMGDQPDCCSKCGTRSETLKNLSDKKCVNECPRCHFIYILEDGGEAEPDLSERITTACSNRGSNDEEIQALNDAFDAAYALLTDEQIVKLSQDVTIQAILYGTAEYRPF